MRRRSGSSSESTSSSRRSGGNAAAVGDQLGLGEQEREHGEPLLALGAEAAKLARAGGEDDVVEVRPEPVTPRSRSRSSRASSVGDRRRLRRRSAARRRGSPSSPARSANGAASSASASFRAATSSRPERCDLLRPRRRARRATSSRRRRGAATRSAARRRAPYSADSCARAGVSRPSDAVEVRAARCRCAFDDAEPVGREDERRRLARAAARPRAAARRSASRACPRRPRASSSISSGTVPRVPRTAMRAARSPKRISCASVRVRGEKPCVATCSDSSRFVLPTPFGPTASTRPGLQARARAAHTTGTTQS